MQEKWTQWKPIKNLSEKYYIDSIVDSWDGFKVTLFEDRNDQNKLTIKFPDCVDSYRYIDESYVQETLTYLNKNYNKNFYSEWCFFKVENSRYLKQLSEESESITNYIEFTHFVLLPGDAMIDIVANYDPIIEIIESCNTRNEHSNGL